MNDNIVVFTGGFDPIHSGHIEAIKHAQTLGRVIIGLNSDDWLIRKKGKPFMPFEERKAVLEQFKNILAVIAFDDADGSACDAIQKVKTMFPKQKIVFVNGGDRTQSNIPEMDKFKDDTNVEFVFSVGGDSKKNSSSWILSEWKHPAETRQWGKFMTYYSTDNVKVKRLVLEPGKSISMQYHEHRSEFWFVESGTGKVYTLANREEVLVGTLDRYSTYTIKANAWHRLENAGDTNLEIIEIQYGESCRESDIVRKIL